MPFRFESLEIWRAARALSSQVHEITATFPRHELFGLASQLNRAANAVSLLIAEGAGLQTGRLFDHRLGLAIGELFEVAAASFLALDRGFISAEEHARIYSRTHGLAKQINAFRDTLR
jgi:four helix bundle protein